jgi:hypothetical protein
VRHLRTIVLFAALMVALDRLVGAAFRYLYFCTSTGEGGGLINRALLQYPEVLILGSSRAKHHFDSEILSKQLSMSVYNAGINGQDFLYAAMLLDVRRQSNTPPKLILLNIDRSSFGENEEERTKAKVFSYYLERSSVVRDVLVQTFSDRLKYLSLSYRANGKALPILTNLRGRPDSENGFVALKGEMKVPVAHDLPTPAPSPMKLKFLEQIVRNCRARGTTLILVNSPYFTVNDTERREQEVWRAQVTEILKPYPDVGFLELNAFTRTEAFQHADLFRDSGHLNRAGSERFSQMLAAELKKRLAANESSVERSLGADRSAPTLATPVRANSTN